MCKKNVLTIAAVAILALAIGQVQAVTVTVPNSDFELIYKPGQTTITATLSPVGNSWTQGVGPDCPIGLEEGLEVGEYEFSDTSTGTVADIPGWLGYDRQGWIALGGTYGRDETTGNLQGSISTRSNHTPGGSNCYVANGGGWQNPAGGLIVSDASLGNILSNSTYTLSMFVKARDGGADPIVLDLLLDGVVVTPSFSVSPVLTGDWQEFTRTYDVADLTSYVGQALTIVLGVGRNSSGDQSQFDDVSLSYYVALPPGQATNPNPADGATDVCPKVVLSWTPGAFVGALSPKHKVFFSENFDNVNDGVGGVTQDPNRYPATGTLSLDFGKTYYWKVDEANSTTGWDEGDIWQFTTEPIAYPIASDKITATASSSKAADEGPENTINGSGLNANDMHSAVTTDMWLSGQEPPGQAWIEYEFDKVYKLHEMWVWNHNSGMEDAIGYGLKDVTIKYSENGTDYTTLGTTHEFARAPGEPGYEHNTEVYFGVPAKYVRLTANSNWGGFLNQYGLSEVRFFRIPIFAREPSPEDGTTGVGPDVVLSWKPGRGVVEHNVYISEYFDDVNDRSILPVIIPADDLCQGSYGPLSLEMDMTYYWRIDEVEADSVTVHRGKVWSFRTKLFIPITDPNLIGWWKLDESEGIVALDSSGHDNHGVLFGDPLWVAGVIGDALEFDGIGDYVLIPNESNFDATDQITVAAWIKVNWFDKWWQAIVTKGDSAWRLHRYQDTSTVAFHCSDQWGGWVGAEGSVNVNDGQWHHLAGVYDGLKLYLYVDGMLDASVNASGSINTNNYPVYIGENAEMTGRYWNGLIDEVRIYDKALTEAEIGRAMSGDPHLAWNPNPRNGATVDVEEANSLGWSPGNEAVSHDVYFGTDEAAVASATLASPEFQANLPLGTESYIVTGLVPWTTYYWRIDEVEADSVTVHRGDVWSFTATPHMPIVDPNLIGWWKFDDEGTGTVIDYSGNNRDGSLHGDPQWVPGADGDALEFDGDDYVLIDGYKGILGANPFTIAAWINKTTNEDCSIVTWGTNADGQRMGFRLDNEVLRFEFGGGNVIANTWVNDGKWHHVAMTVPRNGTLGDVILYLDGVDDMGVANNPANLFNLGSTMDVSIGRRATHNDRFFNGRIDDVRIYDCALSQADIGRAMIGDPHLAWNPNPADGAMVSVEEANSLSWSAGDGAVSHDVYFGTDEAAVASATLASPEFKANQTATTYPLAGLEMETTYYWRIDEVNDADTWKGDTWSFTTGKVYYVDADAEGANDGSNWADGFNDLQDALATAQYGDEVRVAQGVYRPAEPAPPPPPPPASLSPVITTTSASTSDRTATFQLKNGVVIKGGYAGFGESDPNARDIDAYETILSGDLLGNDGPDFANNGENSYHVVTGSGTDKTAVLDGFTITGGNADGSSDITGDMICHWKFDEGQGSIAYDSAGNNDGAVYGAEWTTGKIGTSLDFYGPGRYVTIDPAALSPLAGGSEVTVALWQYGDIYQPIETVAFHATYSSNTEHRVILAHIVWWGAVYWDTVNAGNWDRLVKTAQSHEYKGRWNHWTFTKDASAGEMKIYLNGSLWASATGKHNLLAKAVIFKIGSDINGQHNYGGLIDDMRIYKRALSAEEIGGLYSMDEDRKYGGGMYNQDGSSPTLTNCTFSGNQAEKCGGGMFNGESSPTVRNCMFSGNSAGESGGGIYNGESSPTVRNCMFSGNSAASSGGGMYNEASSPALTNCILWGNIDSGGMDESAQISGAAILNYCCIQGYVEPNEPPTQGMISHWKFDEGEGTTAYDSASNNDGTIYGAEWTTGQMDGALSFDGIDDYVDVGYIGECDELSIALWVNIDSLPHTWNSLFHNNGWESGDVHFIINGGGTVQFALSGNGPTDQFSNFAFSSSTFGKWFHIAVVYRRELRTVDFYINGQHDVQHAYSGARSPVLGPLRIGGWNWEVRNFHGQIDDLRLYNRVLSAEEIEQLYQDGSREGQGNIGTDPWFVEPGYWDANGVWVEGDYHLLPDSPCINAGDPNYIAEPNETDLDGKPRVIGGRIDMGAYEYPNTAPVACIVDGNRIAECEGCWGARVTLDGSCSSDADSTPGTNDDIAHFNWYKVDACDPNFEDFLASGEIIDCNLPLGEHIIVLEVTDKAGAFDTNEVTIIVQDTTPPDFTLSVTPTMLWPANHKMVLITPTWTASDICDESPEVSLVSITMNEGDDTIGDGHTSDDIQIGEDGSIYLRAERSGTGSGRIYTITYQAVDDCGNAAVRSATVGVPHDFKVLAGIAARWLRTNPAGRIPEDLNGDGVVNLVDFAKFAENWIK